MSVLTPTDYPSKEYQKMMNGTDHDAPSGDARAAELTVDLLFVVLPAMVPLFA
jgi:hypothetical protein